MDQMLRQKTAHNLDFCTHVRLLVVTEPASSAAGGVSGRMQEAHGSTRQDTACSFDNRTHVRLLEHVLHGVQAARGQRLLAVRLQQPAVLLGILLQPRVRHHVVVHHVALVALHSCSRLGMMRM
jgi:hypothetical protein